MLVNQKSHSKVDEFHQNFNKKDGGLYIGWPYGCSKMI